MQPLSAIHLKESSDTSTQWFQARLIVTYSDYFKTLTEIVEISILAAARSPM